MSLPAFQREFASKQRKRPAGAINCKSPSRTANWLRTRYPHHRRRNCQYQEVPLRSLQSLRLEPCALDSGSNQWERLSNRVGNKLIRPFQLLSVALLHFMNSLVRFGTNLWRPF